MKIKLSTETKDLFSLYNLVWAVTVGCWFYTVYYAIDIQAMQIFNGRGLFFDLNNIWSQAFIITGLISVWPFVLSILGNMKDWIGVHYKKGVLTI